MHNCNYNIKQLRLLTHLIQIFHQISNQNSIKYLYHNSFGLQTKTLNSRFLCSRRFLVRQWYWTTSLCAGSTVIHSWVWWNHCVNDQRSFLDGFSLYGESVFELGFIVWITYADCVPNEAHRLVALFLLVPQHNLKAAAIMTTVDGEPFSPFIHNLRRRLLEGKTLHSSCEESQCRVR